MGLPCLKSRHRTSRKCAESGIGAMARIVISVDGMNNENFGKYGSRYETVGTLGKTEIAKAIRDDIKFAQTLPETNPMRLPKGIKVSVRCQFYSGGSSINLYVTAFPGELNNRAYLMHNAVKPHDVNPFPRYTNEAERCLSVIERIADQYNFDKSDIQTDYFHVNFYSHVGFGSKLTSETRNAVIECADFVALAEDVKVTMAGGDHGTANLQIASQGERMQPYEQRNWVKSLFAQVTP